MARRATSSGSAHPQGVVTIELPDRREFVWPAATAAMRRWAIGEDVSYGGSRWRVVSRSDNGHGLTLRLRPWSSLTEASRP
jgi:hypothetical protein